MIAPTTIPLHTHTMAELVAPPSAARILFQARNRRGLGHLARGLNIAHELRKLAPHSQIAFYTRNTPEQDLLDGFTCHVEPNDGAGLAHWETLVKQWLPDVTVYDTMLPESLPAATQRATFLMRRCQDSVQHAILANPVLRQFDCILVPHTCDDFPFELPPAIQKRTHFIGPIVRTADPVQQASLRTVYGLEANQLTLVSTPGGGGFEQQAARFIEIIVRAHALIEAKGIAFRHIIVGGPNLNEALFAQLQTRIQAWPNAIAVKFEPHLSSLIGLADLVIAEGGYNTVNEIRSAQVPAIFLPSARSLDDQMQRVMSLAQQGAALVCDVENNPTLACAEQIAALVASPAHRSALHQRARQSKFLTGNVAAARHLLQLIQA